MYDVVIIGAGVTGAFTARQLSRYQLKIALLEKNWDVCCESTRANSAIVHSGYSGKPGSIKAVMTRVANEDFDTVCEELDVEFLRTGSLLIATDEIGSEKIREKYERGVKNGVKGMEIISAARTLEMEPYVTPKVKEALFVPSTGVVNPWEFGLAAVENAMDNGVEIFLNTKVEKIRKNKAENSNEINTEDCLCKYTDKNPNENPYDNLNGKPDEDKDYKSNNDDHKYGSYILETNNGTFETRYIINCAGLYSDRINDMVAKPFFRIAPRRGEYYVLDTEARKKVNHIVFQARDNEDVKGVIIVPTVHGNVLVGPSTEDIPDKDDCRTTAENLESIKKTAEKSIRGLPYELIIRSFAGIRPRPQLLQYNEATGEYDFFEDDVKDFILGEPPGCENFINCAGIKSPGLTCANEIGKYITDLIKEKEGPTLKDNPTFSPRRRPLTRFHLLTPEKQQELIQSNPLYGNIVCRCCQITEAEVVDVIHRESGACTVDGVKRRAGTCLGRCQGGFCTPQIIKILARELQIDPEQVRKDTIGSEILCGRLDGQGVQRNE